MRFATFTTGGEAVTRADFGSFGSVDIAFA